MEEQKFFSFEYPIFSTNCIKIKFTCNSCGTVIEDSICEIPKPNLDGGDTHRSTLNSDCTTISCPSCGNEFTFMLGSSCCGGEIDCDDLEQDDVEIEIL